MRASWACIVVAAAVCAGCGPLLIGAGVSNATSSSSAPDATAPLVTLTREPADPGNDTSPEIRFEIQDDDIMSITGQLFRAGEEVPLREFDLSTDPVVGREFSFELGDGTVGNPELSRAEADRYRFSVSAIDFSGNESNSANTSFDIDTTAPNVGAGGEDLEFEIVEITQQTVEVKWTAVTDGEGHDVSYNVHFTLMNAGGTAGVMTETEDVGADTTHVYEDLLPCSTYLLQVSAKDDLGVNADGDREFNESVLAEQEVRTDCGGIGDFCVDANDKEYFVASGAVALVDFDVAASRILPGDFDEDGVADLAVLTRFARDGSDSAATVAIHLGSGIGTGNTTEFGQNDSGLPLFDAPIIVDIVKEPEEIRTGDFNNDGITDFAIGHRFFMDGISILLGNSDDGVHGNGRFTATNFSSLGLVGPTDLGVPNLNSLVVMDWNRDGIQDIIVGGETSFVPIKLLEGTGVPAAPFVARWRIQLGNLDAVSSLTTADLNNDGLPELIASGFAAGQLEIYDGREIADLAPTHLGGGVELLGVTANVIPVGSTPQRVAAGDFNSDRILDLAVVAPNLPVPGSLRVLLQRDMDGDGAGDGVFERTQTLNIGIAPMTINVADYDADNILDIAIGGGAQLGIYLGEGTDGIGTGTFVKNVLLAENGIVGLATTDLASGTDPERPFGDGVLDLVTVGTSFPGGVGSTGTATLTDNDGSATGVPGLFIAETDPGSIPFAEADDFYAGKTVTFPDAPGSPSFVILAYGLFAPTGEGVFIVDLAGSLLPDAPAAFELEGAQSKIGIYLGKGGVGVADGTFKLPGNGGFDPTLELASVLLGEGAGHIHPFDLIAEDFNGDGIPDFAALMNPYFENPGAISDGFSKQLDTSGFQKPIVSIQLGEGREGRGRGRFSEPNSFTLPRALPFVGAPIGGASSLIDADGDGDGDFAPEDKITGRAESFASGDFNLDGIPDIVVTGGAPDQDPFSYLQILLGEAGGREFLVDINQAAANDGLGIMLGRFGRAKVDQAGLGLDLVLCGSKNNPPDNLSNPAGPRDPSPIVGSGLFRVEGANDPDKPLVLDLTMMDTDASSLGDEKYIAVATGNFNTADTIPDLAAINEASGRVEVYLGRIPSTNAMASEPEKNPFNMAASATFAAGTTPSAIVTGDFNGDKILDLAVANRGSDNVTVFLGNGDGTFGAGTSFETDTGPYSLLAVDLNQDRILDLVTTNIDSDPSTISVLLGGGQDTRGDGTFAPHPTGRDYRTGEFDVLGEGVVTVPRPVAVVAGDFDGDGVIDLIVANQGFPIGTFGPGAGFLDQQHGSISLLLGTNTQLDN